MARRIYGVFGTLRKGPYHLGKNTGNPMTSLLKLHVGFNRDCLTVFGILATTLLNVGFVVRQLNSHLFSRLMKTHKCNEADS
jgi:hypothetical protein